jgi:hypothetical protein
MSEEDQVPFDRQTAVVRAPATVTTWVQVKSS